jgi:hypothetical protein
MLAEQASACLVDIRMLEEYFSVVIEIDEGQDYADGSAVCSKDILLKHTHSDVPSSVGDRS